VVVLRPLANRTLPVSVQLVEDIRQEAIQIRRNFPEQSQPANFDPLIASSPEQDTARRQYGIQLIQPFAFAPIRIATDQWRDAVKIEGSRGIFRDVANDFHIDALSMHVATVRMIAGEASATRIVWEKVLFDEIPLAPLSRTKLRLLPTQYSDYELSEIYQASTGRLPSKEELELFRIRSSVTISQQPELNKVSRRDYLNLYLPPLSYDSLVPAPLNLIRYYHSSDITDSEKHRIILVLAGWVLASSRDRFRANNQRDTFDLLLLADVADSLHAVRPPNLTIVEVRTQHEYQECLAVLQSYGSALASTWCTRFFQETINCISRRHWKERPNAKFKSGGGFPRKKNTIKRRNGQTLHGAQTKIEASHTVAHYEERRNWLTPRELAVTDLSIYN
jgi:hypothetical protein